METYQLTYVAGGCLGSSVAIIHGILMQKHLVAPVTASEQLSSNAKELCVLLLQFSTFVWLVGGIALIYAALFLSSTTALIIASLIALCYLYGAIGNFWATRGRHFGWIPLIAAVLSISWGSIVLITAA
ncbi:MAG: hypothetical protein AAF662_07240 [Pseudomonadota bacterium]